MLFLQKFRIDEGKYEMSLSAFEILLIPTRRNSITNHTAIEKSNGCYPHSDKDFPENLASHLFRVITPR